MSQPVSNKPMASTRCGMKEKVRQPNAFQMIGESLQRRKMQETSRYTTNQETTKPLDEKYRSKASGLPAESIAPIYVSGLSK